MDGDSEERGSAWMETVKREEKECMDGDSEERGSAWMETVKKEETAKRGRECMNGDSEEREGVHGWRQ